MARIKSPLTGRAETAGGEVAVGSSTGWVEVLSLGVTGFRAGTAFMYEGVIETGLLPVLVVLSAYSE